MHETLVFEVFVNFMFERRDVGEHVAMGDYHAFGFCRGARGKDDFEGIITA